MSIRISKAAALPVSTGRGPNDHDRATGAAAAEPKIGAGVNDALQFMAAALTDEQLRTLTADQIMQALPWDGFSFRLYDQIHEHLETVIRLSAVHELKGLGLAKANILTDTTVNGSYDLALIDQYAVQQAETQSGKLVVEISDKMRATIRDTIIAAAAGQISSYDVARMLRDTIPLHSAWAKAVRNTYNTTLGQVLGAQKRPDVAAAQRMAQKMADAHSDRLRTARAWNIARTETMTAANVGKWTGWADGVDKGYIVPDSLKIWEEGRDPCVRCKPLVGEIQKWDEPFSNGQMMPPEHNSCRCTATILPPDKNFLDQMAAQQAARDEATASE